MAIPQTERKADPDWPLVARVQQGDAAAFEELYARYQGPISRLAANVVRHPDMVPDLLQEIFTKVYFALESFKPGMPFRPWLYRLASNHCIDFLRKRRRQPLAADPPRHGEESGEWEFADPATDALTRLVSRDLAEKLLSELKPRDRWLLVMQDIEGFSLEEIAQASGLGLSAVKVGLFRARKRLLERYGKLVSRSRTSVRGPVREGGKHDVR